MSKEYLEALEKFLDDYLTLCEKLHTNRQEKMLLDKNSPYNVLKTYLESIDNANPSEAMKCLKNLFSNVVSTTYNRESSLKDFNTIKQALLKAQEQKALDLLMQELDCKDFAELRKYARCGKHTLSNLKGSQYDNIMVDEFKPKHCLKWEDLEFKEKAIYKRVTLNGELYLLKSYRNFILDFDIVELEKTDGTILFHISQHNLQFFNDLHLERVEE